MRPRCPPGQFGAIYRRKPVFFNGPRTVFHLSHSHLNDRRFVIILVKMQMIPRACGRFRLIGLCGDHGLIGLNSSLAVHRRRIWVWVRSQGRRIDRQSLIFVFQIQIFLQRTRIDRMSCGAIPALLGQLQIPPPFFDRIERASSGHIIHFCQNWCHLRHGHRRPAEGRFSEEPLQVPWAGFHAASTHSATRGTDAIAGAFLTVRFPNLIAIEHQFWPSCDRPGWAFAGAFIAALAEPLQTKINWLVMGKWQARGHHTRFQPRTQKRVQDHFANSAHLPQTGQQKQRRLQHLTIHHRMRLGRIAQVANMLRQNSAQKREPQIGPHGLRH